MPIVCIEEILCQSEFKQRQTQPRKFQFPARFMFIYVAQQGVLYPCAVAVTAALLAD